MKLGIQSTLEASSNMNDQEKYATISNQEGSDNANLDQKKFNHYDVIFKPNPFQGDGRKREVKRHRNKEIVAL